MPTVYLIHFKEPYKHARHYVGFAHDLQTRLDQHRAGNGARLMEVITEAGIDWEVARTWEEQDRNFERRIHNQNNTKKLCPICSELKAYNRKP